MVRRGGLKGNQYNGGFGRQLMLACKCGHLNIVKFFVEECAVDANYSLRNGDIPLTLACQHEHVHIVGYFLRKSNINLSQLLDQIPHEIVANVKGAVVNDSLCSVG